ncbi:MAG TPA: PilW family protein [Burkholderiales bacterium]|nr:PilW family protein [Burkholderiales bacterium]
MRASAYPSSRGFSMVELMVAMLIGLIGMIIIFQVFEVSESIKRTTTSGGDAQQNGVIALYTMERDLKNAGMGINYTTLAGCSIVGWDSKRATPAIPPLGQTLTLAPVVITAGAGTTNPDQFTVLYGSAGQAAGASPLSLDLKVATDPLALTNPFGYNPGDMLLLAETPAKNCSLMEVTKVDSSGVYHDPAATYTVSTKGGTTTYAPRFNKAGGLGVTYTAVTTKVFNLGNLYYIPPDSTEQIYSPVYNTYAINNNSLTVTTQFAVDGAGQPLTTVVADNIVHMRVLYGLDDGNNDGITAKYNAATKVAGDGIVDRFVDAATFNAIVPAPWAQVIAIRLAIVSRSAQPEKPTQGLTAVCDATPNEPWWTGTDYSINPLRYNTRLDLSATGDPSATSLDNWTCYRYRVFETTIPLRNWIWKSS